MISPFLRTDRPGLPGAVVTVLVATAVLSLSGTTGVAQTSADPFPTPADTAPDGTPPLRSVAAVLTPRGADNLPTRLGQMVRVRGVITSDPRHVDRASHVAEFQDATGGAPLFVRDTVTLKPFAAGDSVEVVGVLDHNDGLEEIRVRRIVRLGHTDVPEPIDVDAGELDGERYSGRLVRVTGRVSRTAPGDAGAFRVVDETGEAAVYVRRGYYDDPEFAHELLDAHRASVVGIAAQNDETAPYDEGYDLLPRSPADFTFYAPPPYLSWGIGLMVLLLLGVSAWAWRRRVRAEERVGTLARLTRDLERREAILGAVAFAGGHFLEAEDAELPVVLDRLTEATSAEGCAVLRVPADDEVGEGGQASAEDASGQAPGSADDPSDGPAWLRHVWGEAPEADAWRERLAMGEAVQVSAAGSDALRAVAEEGGSHGMLMIPVFSDGALWGALTFHCSGHREVWSEAEIDAVSAAAAMIGAAVSRRTTLRALHEREEQLRQAQKMEAIGRLAGGIAHDFNNLLTAVGGNAALLVADRALAGENRDLAREIVDNVERGSTLARHLLAFSRRQALPSEIQDAAAITRDMLPMLGRLLGEQVELDARIDDGAWVSLPPGHLEQVVMNLAVNAFDAMEDGGRLTVSVTRTDGDDGPEAVIEVADTGTGMDAKTINSVFDPFFTTKSGGSGLGLSIVYGIVLQADGRIDVDSELGEGTRITIRVPGCAAPEVDDRDPTEVDDGPAGSAIVLLVEDEGAVRSLARRVLVRDGYTVLEAEDGLSALDVYHDHEGCIDLLLTDVRMPGMSGAQLADRIVEEGCTCPVLFMSGYAAEELELGEVGPGRYLAKPFTPKQLTERVAGVITDCPHRTRVGA